MIVRSKRILEKLIAKNLGNKRLAQAVDQLIADLESDSENAIEELLKVRKDADRVHSRGFYFFNLHTHRTLVFIQLLRNQATIIWAGTHEEYSRTFRNNTNSIEKWLRTKNLLN
jgi:hypothetical protein